MELWRRKSKRLIPIDIAYSAALYGIWKGLQETENTNYLITCAYNQITDDARTMLRTEYKNFKFVAWPTQEFIATEPETEEPLELPDCLTPLQEAVVRLKFEYGLNTREIAELFGTTRQAQDYALRKAIEKIRKEILCGNFSLS